MKTKKLFKIISAVLSVTYLTCSVFVYAGQLLETESAYTDALLDEETKVQDIESEEGECKYELFDFTSEELCSEMILNNNIEHDDINLSMREPGLGGYGILAEYEKTGGASFTIGKKIDLDKYKYAKIAFAYPEIKNKTAGNTEKITSYIQFDDGTKSNIAVIEPDGKELTDCNGVEHKRAEYLSNVKITRILSIVVPLGEDSVGVSDVRVCPGFVGNDAEIGCKFLLKYLAFFETKEDAENFDNSISRVEVDFNKGEKFEAEIDPIARVAEVNLPKLYIKEGELKEDNIKIELKGETIKVTLTEVDGFNVKYNIASYDGVEREWIVKVNCAQIDAESIPNMISALNGATNENIFDVVNEWDWIWLDKCSFYEKLSDKAEEVFESTLLTHKGEYTAENYIDLIDDETVFAKLITAENIETVKSISEEVGFSETGLHRLFFEKIGDSDREDAIKSVLNANNFSELCDKLIVAIFNCSISYENIKFMIEEDLNLFGYDSLSYNELCEKTDNLEKAYKNIVGADVANRSDVIKALENAIKKVGKNNTKKPTNQNVSGGSGGASGGKFGGQVSIALPGKTAQSANEISGTEANTNNNSYQNLFIDLEGVSWAKDSILNLCKRGIVNGKANKIFAPEDAVTREEFVKMIVVGLKLNIGNTANAVFADVKENEWYTSYIKAALNEGIITGESETKFGIGECITRQDMAVIAYRAMRKIKEIPETADNSFDDKDEISSYAINAVSVLSKNEIINGNNNAYNPLKNASRAETAVMLNRLIDFVEK